jgi:hypothetical protein
MKALQVEFSVLFPGMPWIKVYATDRDHARKKALSQAKWLIKHYPGEFKLESEQPERVDRMWTYHPPL